MPSGNEERLHAAARLLGLKLRKARSRAGLTLVEASEQAGLSQSYISDCERGRGLPSLPALLALADAYGVLVSNLIRDTYPFGSAHMPDELPPPPADARFTRS